MAKFKLELDRAGVGQLLRSAEVQNYVEEITNSVQSRCGEGYESNYAPNRTRTNGYVIAVTRSAKQDNLENNTLLKAVSG